MSRLSRIEVSGKEFAVDLSASTVNGRKTSFALETDRADAREGTIRIDGARFRYRIAPDPQCPASGRILIGGHTLPFRLDAEEGARKAGGRGGPDPVVRAHMPGLLVKVAVAPGEAVEPGTLLAVLEAMKMQNEIRARVRGRVRTVHAAAGASLEGGAILMTIDLA